MRATFRAQGTGEPRGIRAGRERGGAIFMSRTTGIRRAAMLVLAASALAGCSTTDGLDSMLVDPSRYEGYNCNDLGKQLQALDKRQKDLRNLIDRAGEGAGGVVIGALTYRTDYETVIADKKVLQRTMAEKKCQLTPALASDQIIR
jgi:hypothetical protein